MTERTLKTPKDMQLRVRERLEGPILPLLEVGLSLTRADEDLFEWLGPAKVAENITRAPASPCINNHDATIRIALKRNRRKLLPRNLLTTAPFKVFTWVNTEMSKFRGEIQWN